MDDVNNLSILTIILNYRRSWFKTENFSKSVLKSNCQVTYDCAR